MNSCKVLLFANTDWYLYNYRLPLAEALRSLGYEVVLVSPAGQYSLRLEQAGFRWINFDLSRKGINILFESIAILRLVHLFRTEQPQIVHFFTIKPVLYGSLAAHITSIKGIINSITGLGHLFTSNRITVRLIKQIVRLFYRLALRDTIVIFQNNTDREIFIKEKLVLPTQSYLIPGSGVDLHRFSYQLEEKSDVPLVILPGRMLWEKGVKEFVEAAQILKSEKMKIRFALVGASDAGNPSAIPSSQLGKWQKSGLVEWWSWREDMPNVLSQAHIICVPSYREGMPKTLLEASACGRAVIASDVPGCRDVVKHGISGLIIPVRDSIALAQAIRLLIQNPKLRKRFGKQGRIIIQKGFSLEHVITETIKIYKTI